MKKSIREFLFNECNQNCGYCGRKIEYKEMQVDHIVPQRINGYHGSKGCYTTKEKINDIENLLCTCRKCNHYKRANSVEGFRELIKTLHNRLLKTYIFEVGLNFGITTIGKFDGIFYFEKIKLKKYTNAKELLTLTPKNNVGKFKKYKKNININGKNKIGKY